MSFTLPTPQTVRNDLSRAVEHLNKVDELLEAAIEDCQQALEPGEQQKYVTRRLARARQTLKNTSFDALSAKSTIGEAFNDYGGAL